MEHANQAWIGRGVLLACGILELHALPGARGLDPKLQVEQRFEEFEIRAAFLFSLAKFTDWPEQSLPAGSPLIIGVVGTSPMALALERAAIGPLQGHRIVVKRFRPADEVPACHILYFPQAEERFLPAIRDRLSRQAVFTIGETSFFLGYGGALQLFTEEGRLRFVINRPALDHANLRVPAKVQRLAKHVIQQP